MNIWKKEGKYLDLWSVTHFLSGIVVGGWLMRLGVDMWWALGIYIIAAVGWEIYELYNVPEHTHNRFVDVILGVVGLFIYIWADLDLTALIVISVVYAIMEIHGYVSYKARQ